MVEGLAEGLLLEKVNRRNDMIYNGSCQHCLLCLTVQFIFQFILFAFINYNTKLHIVIIHLAGSPGSY